MLPVKGHISEDIVIESRNQGHWENI
jgi:hypothetical protein